MKNKIIKTVMIINTFLFLTGISMIDTKCNIQSVIITLFTILIYAWFFKMNEKIITK